MDGSQGGVRYRSPYCANDLLAFAGPQQQKNLKLEMKLASHQQKRENPGKKDCLRKILQLMHLRKTNRGGNLEWL